MTAPIVTPLRNVIKSADCLTVALNRTRATLARPKHRHAVQGSLWERVAETVPRWTLERGYVKAGVEVIVSKETTPGTPRHGAYEHITAAPESRYRGTGIQFLVEPVTVHNTSEPQGVES
jgi:hypothetical protein